MATSRYSKNQITRTGGSRTDEQYSDLLANRNVTSIVHYSHEPIKELKIRDILGIQIDTHIWESSDRFFKLADKYYGDPTYWWIIATFNGKPLETDVKLGEKVFIPIPLETILSAMGY